MRQTSQAVLLLLGAASAATVVDPKFLLSTQADGTPTISIANQATSTRLTGTLNPVYTPAVALPTVAVATAVDGASKASTGGEKSCVDCVRSNSVWCSAGWNYEYVSLPLATAYPDPATANAAMTWDNTGAAAGSSTASPLTSGDLGACCYTTADAKTEFVKDITASPTLDTVKFNKYTCPAKLTGEPATGATYNSGSTAANKATQMLHSANNWWCSDGSFNLKDVTDDTYSTNGATESSNMKDPAAWAADSYSTGKLLEASANPLTQDKRLELFLAACRQKRLICGASHVGDAVVSGETMKRTIVKTADGFSTSEKCTWTLRSKTKAPTFAISQATKDKQLPSNYDVVYQEWVDGWQLDAGADFLSGYDGATAGTTATTQGGIPLPSMTAAKYGSVYKYNYEGTAVAGTNNAQVPGEAFTYHRTSAACATDATNLNTGNNDPDNCWNLNMEKRWFSLDPSGAQYQNALAADYTSKLTAYNADATKYNAYLAKVKENAEVDAFAAFFSPPEKPALVKRPAAPTQPAAYTGMAHWSVAKQQNWRLLKGGAANDPTPGTEYILGNNKMGGWGSWTISRLVGGYQTAEEKKISHSFGMLGTTQSATLDTGRSYLKNWQKTVGLDTTTGSGTTGARVAAQYVGRSTANQWKETETGSVMCPAEVSTATHACGWTSGSKSAINSKWVYLNISVWANGSSAQTQAQWTAAAYDMEIQFYASAWAGGTDYYSPAAAATGTTLTEPAAAQALAASAAAALAVAAALY